MGKNAHVRYSMGLLLPGVPAVASFVSVDVESRTMRALCPLDYESVHAFQVEMRAVDGGSLPLSTQVVLRMVVRDENDNAPVVLHLPLTAARQRASWCCAGHGRATWWPR